MSDRWIPLLQHMLHLDAYPRFRFRMRENVELLVPDGLEHTFSHLSRRHPLLRRLPDRLRHRRVFGTDGSRRIIAKLARTIALSIDNAGIDPSRTEYRYLHV